MYYYYYLIFPFYSLINICILLKNLRNKHTANPSMKNEMVSFFLVELVQFFKDDKK